MVLECGVIENMASYRVEWKIRISKGVLRSLEQGFFDGDIDDYCDGYGQSEDNLIRAYYQQLN